MSSHQNSHDAAAAAYPYGDYDSDHSYGAPAFPSTPTPSNMPFPHQSPLGSGTTVLEPSYSGHSGSEGLTFAQNIQNRWREAQQNPMPMPYTATGGSSARGGHGNEMSEKSSRLSSNHGYSNPYDRGDPSDGTSRSGQQPPSPSIGPWDSASQRFPIAQPSIVPLSGEAKHLRNKPSYAGGLSYIDEEGAYYKSEAQRPASALNGDELEMRGLVGNAAGMGHFDDDHDIERNKLKFTEYDQSPYPYPLPPEPTGRNVEPSGLSSSLLFSTGLDRLLGLFGSKAGKFPVQQAIERKRRGLGGQRWPVASWMLTVVMCSLMVYELVKNNSITGSPIATKPQFNYMIGPQPSVLINIGARFPPCMKLVSALPPSFPIACMNDTNNPPTSTCNIEEICGHGGFDGRPPDQSWRFVVPIFLHVGIIHLLLNMVAQVTAAAQVEREMGTIPFLLTYLAGGIYGFVLGGNFSRTGIPSVGASGALFATNACVLVDLVLHWKYEERPKLKAFLLFIEFAIGFGIGYIPNAVDGLAHLGGWAIGILMGIILYPSISETKRRRYILWGVRVLALALLVMAFVLTIRNFYTDDPNAACTWCKYLSCIPTASNNRCSGTGITTTQVQTTRRSWDSL